MDWFEFDIHGKAAMRVDASAPTAAILAETFAPFRASGIGSHDVTITATPEPIVDAARDESAYRYTETALLHVPSGSQLVIDGDGIRLHGRGELLTWVLPVLDWVLAEKGVAMVHAATAAHEGRGVCVSAAGGGGKTSTMAKLLRGGRFDFMGDDWTFVTAEGTVLGYPKPMFIKSHHRALFPELFTRRRKPLVPRLLLPQFAAAAQRVHPIITRYPRLTSWLRKWSPEHLMVHPDELFPAARIARSAELASVIFVERHGGDEVEFVPRTRAYMTSRLIGNYFSELPRQSRELVTALGAAGLLSPERVFAAKAAVLQRALAGADAHLVRVPARFAPDQASDIIAECVRSLCAGAVELAPARLKLAPLENS